MEKNPYQPPAAGNLAPAGLTGSNAGLVRPLYDVKGWLKLLGVLNIIIGVIYCITIIGAIFGWIPLLLGIKANKSSNELREGFETSDESKVQSAIRNLATCIKMVGILTLIALIINVIVLIAQLGALFMTGMPPQ